MITAIAGAQFEAALDNAPTGLVGTIGYKIEDTLGNTVVARTTAGIVASAPTSYLATVPAAPAAGMYVLVWDTGGTSPTYATETLTVTVSPDPGQGYVSATQVMALDTGRRYTASSQPNPDQVTQFVLQAAGEIDGVLRRRGYTLPVATTAVSALQYLRQGNMLGANALVEQSAPGGASDRRDAAYKMWQDWLKGMASGSVELDAPKDPTTSNMRYAQPTPTALFRRCQEF